MRKIKLLYGLEAVGGGALKHLSYLVSHLDKSKFEITVVCSNLRNDNPDKEIDKIESSGAKIIYLPIKKNIQIFSDLTVLFRIVKILQKGKFDVIHAHSSKAGGLFRMAGFLNGNKNLLYTPHCFYFQSLRGAKKRIFIYLEKILARFTQYIIVSQGERQEIIKYGVCAQNRIKNINNAIDFTEYNQSSEVNQTLHYYSIPKGKFVVGAIGRLAPQKDWETFVFSANEVLKSYPDTIFLITGEGELKNDIEKLIFSLGLEKSIILTGYVNEIHKIFGIMDVFVNTSLWEGLPYVLLEAMKYKKPVIATNTGNEEVIDDHKSGFITPVKDYNTIAKKICDLIKDKNKKLLMGEEGNAILTRKYSFESFIKEHEMLYLQMTSDFPTYSLLPVEEN